MSMAASKNNSSATQQHEGGLCREIETEGDIQPNMSLLSPLSSNNSNSTGLEGLIGPSSGSMGRSVLVFQSVRTCCGHDVLPDLPLYPSNTHADTHTNSVHLFT